MSLLLRLSTTGSLDLLLNVAAKMEIPIRPLPSPIFLPGSTVTVKLTVTVQRGKYIGDATLVTSDEETTLWKLKVIIGDHSPVALQRTVFFYVGKAFCLCGGEEQCNLKPSQFIRSWDLDCYTCIESGSKNRSGINTKENNKGRSHICMCRVSSALSGVSAGYLFGEVFYWSTRKRFSTYVHSKASYKEDVV